MTNGVTSANFHAMIEIVLVISDTYLMKTDNGERLPRDSQPLLPGNYFIVTDDIVDASIQRVVTRPRSHNTRARLESFRNQLREREGRCKSSPYLSSLFDTNDIRMNIR